MPTAWFQSSMLRTAALVSALLLVLAGCHYHHRGGHGYHNGGHHSGGHYRSGKRGYHETGRHNGGWRGRY